MFLKISQNSQENSCARGSFLIKLQAEACNLLKKGLWHRCFLVNFVNFLKHIFCRTPLHVEVSEISIRVNAVKMLVINNRIFQTKKLFSIILGLMQIGKQSDF